MFSVIFLSFTMIHISYIYVYQYITLYNTTTCLQHWFQGTHAGESHLTQPTSKGKLSLSRRHLLPLFECQYENWEQRESNGICAFRTCKAWRGCIWHGRMFYWVCYGVWWCVMVCECVWWCVCVCDYLTYHCSNARIVFLRSSDSLSTQHFF